MSGNKKIYIFEAFFTQKFKELTHFPPASSIVVLTFCHICFIILFFALHTRMAPPTHIHMHCYKIMKNMVFLWQKNSYYNLNKQIKISE